MENKLIMSYINDKPAEEWIEANHPENGLFRVYWTEDEEVVSLENTGLPIRYEWYYKDGKRADGVSKGWYKNGKMKHEQYYQNGMQHGKDIWYYQNGQKIEEGIYLNNFHHGKCTYWNEDGEKKLEIIFRRGKIVKEEWMGKTIINIGFNRAATTSLSNALKILGFKTLHNVAHKDIDIFWNNINQNQKLLQGFFNKYDAFLDYPFLNTSLLSLLIEQYPDAYFIYTKRNHADRYESIPKIEKRMPFPNAIKLTKKPLIYEEVKKHWAIWQTEKEKIIDYIVKRNSNIKVLEFNVCDEGHGWKELCGFLDKDVPSVDFPHENKNPFRKYN